jgi:transketolase
MRGTFIRTLAELAEKDERIVLLTGDLGFMAIEAFAERHPERFFNVGVAEQNMVGLATGLAESGYTPYVYSIATFATLRPYEFIRNGPVLHQLPVRIVGVGGGVEYGTNGPSHYALEDVALMRAQPGMTVIAPADYEQTRTALLAAKDVPGPIYYRLGKDDVTTIAGLEGRFSLGRAETIGDGRDILIVTMGSIAREAVAAVELLSARGVSATVLVVASLSPAPVADLADMLARFDVALTVEAHYRDGGLGSLVCEVAAERASACRVVRRAVDRVEPGVSGSEAYLYGEFGLSAAALADAAVAVVGAVRLPSVQEARA